MNVVTIETLPVCLTTKQVVLYGLSLPADKLQLLYRSVIENHTGNYAFSS